VNPCQRHPDNAEYCENEFQEDSTGQCPQYRKLLLQNAFNYYLSFRSKKFAVAAYAFIHDS
jgi:hypothetical protein